jgi:hypothetical protein
MAQNKTLRGAGETKPHPNYTQLLKNDRKLTDKKTNQKKIGLFL